MTRLGTLAWLCSLTMALAMAIPERAEAQAANVNIRAGPLVSGLRSLARQTGVEILFDPALVRGARTPSLRGRYQVDAALRRLLAGTDLGIRRSSGGAWLIGRRPEVPRLPDPLEAPEILVIGRRTQNFDIRRREDDVQPYQVTTGDQVSRAHRDNIDQYFRSRVTANTQIIPPSLGELGDTRSEIDLRGLGPSGTLILVDGRRLPGAPEIPLAFQQPDLNAIPAHAIERIETLTGTAGGIHGFGALGGVVNVVLRRDYRGLELHGTAGVSTGGDARRLSAGASLGFSPNDGQTEFVLAANGSWSQPLLEGQSDFLRRARELGYRRAPDRLVATLPGLNAVSVFSADETDLVLTPEFGGTSLGSPFTHLAIGFGGTRNELGPALLRRAGQLDVSLTEAEQRTAIGSNPRTFSLVANVRHLLGGGFEGYVDALILRNRGVHLSRASSGTLILLPGDPQNPFENFVFVTFPAPMREERLERSSAIDRFSFGLIAPLVRGWRGTAELTFGRAGFEASGGNPLYYDGPLFLDGSESIDFNPFGNWDAFQRAARDYRFSSFSGLAANNHYREQSLRLAGPLFRSAAGPATLTLLAEHRREHVPATQEFLASDRFGPLRRSFTPIAARTSNTTSFYAELRAPILGEDSRITLLRGLEAQVAVRRDIQKFDFARFPLSEEDEQRVQARFSATAYTVGARFSPFRGLLLRGSFATGHQPPPLQGLVASELDLSASLIRDPKRGNAFFVNDYRYLLLGGGSADLTTGRATTLSLGAVLRPFGDQGPRFSLDYSLIRRERDFYELSEAFVLAREDDWPERVVREPLSEADRAAGFTGGRIVQIDARAINAGGLRVRSIDGRVDWPLPVNNGTLRLYAVATLQLENVTLRPFDPEVDRVGYRSGPLRWRANGGAEWTTGSTVIGANLQYFSRYEILEDPTFEPIIESFVAIQGSRWVRSQIYVDLHASHRFGIPGTDGRSEATVGLGIVNLLDQMPPFEAESFFLGSQYSRYGDPRGRRIELTLGTSF